MSIVLSLTILFTAIMNNGIFALAKSSARSWPSDSRTGAERWRFLERPFGGKERSAMKKKIVYTAELPDVDLEHAVRVKDFLPGPKTLILRKERVVAVRLDDSTVSELKKVADQKGLGVSSLVRMWVRERLTKAHASL
jgi:hypothetical protein